MDSKTLTKINNELIDFIKEFNNSKKLVGKTDITDRVFERDRANIAVNTWLASKYDIEDIASNFRYEDNIPINRIGTERSIFGIISYITIDTGNTESSQSGLSNNGYITLELDNYLKNYMPSNWRTYIVNVNLPIYHPFHSNNVFSIITIKGLYEVVNETI